MVIDLLEAVEIQHNAGYEGVLFLADLLPEKFQIQPVVKPRQTIRKNKLIFQGCHQSGDCNDHGGPDNRNIIKQALNRDADDNGQNKDLNRKEFQDSDLVPASYVKKYAVENIEEGNCQKNPVSARSAVYVLMCCENKGKEKIDYQTDT